MAWIAKNAPLTRNEMINNAGLFYDHFAALGWSVKAIAATLGNSQWESGINPGRWEGGKPFGGGYGLFQWTPYTKYSRWAGANWQNNGVKQCERLEWEWRNKQQWIEKVDMSFDEYVHSDANLSWLTEVFMRNYERPGVPHLEDRIRYAYTWYEWLTGEQPDPDDPFPEPPPDPGHRPPSPFRGVELWYVLKMNNNNKERLLWGKV